MTVLFIHGVPDTHRLWAPVLERLEIADPRCLLLPGFDAPVCDGFACTMDAYARWLQDELERITAEIGGPVDLVGHDWGGLFIQRVAGMRPALVRSWAVGGVAVDETYVWHDIAQIWQTPGEGEALMEAMDEAAFAEALIAARVPEVHAREMAQFGDAAMREAILKLYRSASTIGTDWADCLVGLGTRPGLVLWGEHDPYAGPEFGRRLAERAGARFHLFEDCGHWWPYERPAETAETLAAFWAGL